MEKMNNSFDEFASFYEQAFSSTTGPFAADALEILPPITSSSIIHDNACGPGVVSRIIIDQAKAKHLDPLPSIRATDFAEGMIKATQAVIDTQKLSTVKAEVMNAQDLSGIKDNTFTHSITNFVIFALPDPVKAAKEIYRTLKPGGVAAVTTWRHSGSLELFKRVAKAVRPNEPVSDPISKDWSESWKPTSVMEEAGFSKSNIKVEPRDGVWKPNSVDEMVEILSHPFWRMFRQGWTEEEEAQWQPAIREQLTDEERDTASLRMDAWICVATK